MDAACTHIERAIAETTSDEARELLTEALAKCQNPGPGGVTTQGGGGGTTNPTDPKPPKNGN